MNLSLKVLASLPKDQSNPLLDKLVSEALKPNPGTIEKLKSRLKYFEETHGMSSEIFSARLCSSRIKEDSHPDYVEWVHTLDTLHLLKKLLQRI